MSEVAVLREFLISLGFRVDAKGEKELVDTVTQVTVKVVNLGVQASAAAALVVAGVAKIAESLESLYFTSKRTGATVENLQAIGFAAEQMGSSSEAAIGAVESIARLLRTSPGGEGLLKNIGVQTRDATGGLRDTVDMLGDLGDKFRAMPYYKANAYAQALGVDEKTLMAMREGMGQFSTQYRDMLHASGMDAQKAAKDSHDFMVELRSLRSLAGLLAQAVASKLVGPLGASIKRFRETAVVNLQRVAGALAGIITVALRVGGAFAILAGRVGQVFGFLIEKFNGLSEGSQTILKWLGAILVAWKVLNAGFLASPIGRIVALITALALLWDDYQTWKEGGKSLIDWAAWAPGIEAALSAISVLASGIHGLLEPLGDLRPAFEAVLAYVGGSWLVGMLGAVSRATAAMIGLGGASAAAVTAGAGAAGAGVAGAAAGVGGLTLAGAALPATLAAGAGYVGGSLLYKHALDGNAAGNAVGAGITRAMALVNLGGAREALQNREAIDHPHAAPALAHGPLNVDVAAPVVNVAGSRAPSVSVSPPAVSVSTTNTPPATPNVSVSPRIVTPAVNVAAPAAPAAPRAAVPVAPVANVARPGATSTPVVNVAAPVAVAPVAPRGIRNNNPGNIEYGSFAQGQGATGPEDNPEHRFARFKSAEQGLAALAILLRGYAAKGFDSVASIISRYSPKDDKGNAPGSTENYIANTSKRLGVLPTQRLDLGDPKMLANMMDAIVRFENTRNPYRPEQITAAAQAAPAPSKTATLHQTTTITVQGGTDRAPARDIAEAQNSVNERLVRNMRGSILQ